MLVALIAASAAADPALWLPPGGPAQVWDEYAELDLAADCGTADEYVAAPLSITDPLWVRACAWQYLLNQALPTYAWAPGERITQISAPNFVRPGAPAEPRDHLAAADARAYGVVLERLALAWMLASEDPDPSAPTKVGWYAEREYGPAVRYWGGYLTEIGPWRELRAPLVAAPLDDLERGRLLIGLSVAYDWFGPALPDDERLRWRDTLAREAEDLEQTLILGDPIPTAPFSRRRVLANSHAWWRYAALGIAGSVLADEPGLEATADGWREVADTFFSEVLTGWDGTDPNGVFYGEHQWEAALRWIEATRLADPDSADLYTGWVQDLPRFFQHMTLPNGQRATFGDGAPQDLDKPSWLLARIADEDGREGTLAQRLAWQGHNRWTYTENRRDVLDVTWWNPDLAPLSDAGLAAMPTHACFPQVGYVSLRGGWDAHAVHLVGRAGPLVGGHDDPDVGSLSLYGDGHLVGNDRQNNVAKRTALHSTLLVGGKGQHGNFRAFGLEPPDNTDGSTDLNDSAMIAFLDGKGAAKGPRGAIPVDVVAYGVDLTQLYRYDVPGDDVHWTQPTVSWYTQVDGLAEVRRWVVWLGPKHVLLYDRARGSPSPRLDWTLRAVRTDANDLVTSCPTETTGGLPRYADSQGRTLGLQFYPYYTENSCDHPDEFPCIRCVAGTATCPSRTALMGQLDRGEWTPVAAGICAGPATVAGGIAQIAPGGAGKLQVVALDGLPLTARPATNPDGSRIEGQSLVRTRTGGSFLTALQPYTGSAPAPDKASKVTGGWRAEVALGNGVTATALFVEAGLEGASESGRSGSAVTGDGGVVVTSGKLALSAQVWDGTALAWKGASLVTASRTASVAVTWGPDGPWGTVDGVSGPVDVWVSLQGGEATAVEITAADGTSSRVTPVITAGGARFQAPGRSTFRVVAGSAAPAGPEGTCFGS